MISVSEAFENFSGNLEITPTESDQASKRQQSMREHLDDSTLDIADTFLTGAYRRATKTKPLADVDIMAVLSDRTYLDKHPHKVLEDVRAILAPIYGEDRVCCDRRAVRVDFGVKLVDDLKGDVVSFDVVPAFTEDDHYLIPDDVLAKWIPTNPKVHEDLAVQANKDFSERWKPLVKMIKTWNRHHGHPIEASFLIEVMALELVKGVWAGPYPGSCDSSSPLPSTPSRSAGRTRPTWARMSPTCSTAIPRSSRPPSRPCEPQRLRAPRRSGLNVRDVPATRWRSGSFSSARSSPSHDRRPAVSCATGRLRPDQGTPRSARTPQQTAGLLPPVQDSDVVAPP